MEIWGKRRQAEGIYTFLSNFKYLTFSLKNEKFPIHPKTVKNKLLVDADIKRLGEEEVKNLVDVFHGWSKHT